MKRLTLIIALFIAATAGAQTKIFISTPPGVVVDPSVKARMAKVGAAQAFIFEGVDPDDDGQYNWSGVRNWLNTLPKGATASIGWEGKGGSNLSTVGAPFNRQVGGFVSLAQRIQNARPDLMIGWYGLPFCGNRTPGSAESLADRTLGGMQHEATRWMDCMTQSIYVPPPSSQPGTNFDYLDQVKAATAAISDGKPIIGLIRSRYPESDQQHGLELIPEDVLIAWIRHAVSPPNGVLGGLWLWTDGEPDFRRYSVFSVPPGHKDAAVYARAKAVFGDRYKNADGTVNQPLIDLDVADEQRWLLGVVYEALNPSAPAPPAQAVVQSDGSVKLTMLDAAGNQSTITLPALANGGANSSSNPIVNVDVLNAVIAAWGVEAGGAGMDDLLTVINHWGGACIRPQGHSTGAALYTAGGDVKDLVIYCADDSIQQGIEVAGTASLSNVLIIGSWQAVNCKPGSHVTMRNVHAINCRAQPAGGGYGLWSDAESIDASDCVFALGPTAWQYPARTTGTRMTLARCTFIGTHGKAYSTRMTQSTGNTIADCTWWGNTPSFGGGEAGPGVGDFAGTIERCTFNLYGASRVTIQPGVNGLTLTDCNSPNKPSTGPGIGGAPWISISGQASNVKVQP